MKHFKFILFFLIYSPLIRAQECTSGNCKNGFGTLENKTTTNTGSFKESRMHGKGEYVWKDGGSYIGNFREVFFEGNGERSYENGTIYKRHFKYDKPHGDERLYAISFSKLIKIAEPHFENEKLVDDLGVFRLERNNYLNGFVK